MSSANRNAGVDQPVQDNDDEASPNIPQTPQTPKAAPTGLTVNLPPEKNTDRAGNPVLEWCQGSGACTHCKGLCAPHMTLERDRVLTGELRLPGANGAARVYLDPVECKSPDKLPGSNAAFEGASPNVPDACIHVTFVNGVAPFEYKFSKDLVGAEPKTMFRFKVEFDDDASAPVAPPSPSPGASPDGAHSTPPFRVKSKIDARRKGKAKGVASVVIAAAMTTPLPKGLRANAAAATHSACAANVENKGYHEALEGLRAANASVTSLRRKLAAETARCEAAVQRVQQLERASLAQGRQSANQELLGELVDGVGGAPELGEFPIGMLGMELRVEPLSAAGAKPVEDVVILDATPVAKPFKPASVVTVMETAARGKRKAAAPPPPRKAARADGAGGDEVNRFARLSTDFFNLFNEA